MKAITEPTVIYDLDEAEYHAHQGSLSASGAKMLSGDEACPAKFRWRQDHPEIKAAFDFGHAAHRLVLGKGNEIEILTNEDGEPFTSMRTNAAKAAEDAAREAGLIPMLEDEFARAKAVADAVQADPIAGPLFTEGQAEVSLFWPDAETGVVRRARLDWVRNMVPGSRTLIGDLKTARNASRVGFGKSAADFGYAVSAANYIDGLIACGIAEDPVFLLVAVEKTEPYVVSTYQVDEDDLRIGRYLMREALHTYARCVAEDRWPGYQTEVESLELPYYYTRKFEDIA